MRLARLLVSVRSPDEARAAVSGGADLVDVKEPSRGPLGRADVSTWDSVRAVVPSTTPVSVALGELREWTAQGEGLLSPSAFLGLTYRKLGLAGAGSDWVEEWARLRRSFGGGPSWVAVVYGDWAQAGAPSPDAVLDVVLEVGDCAGVLFDTWDKASASPIDLSWSRWFDRARGSGLFTVLAGRVDRAAVGRLAALRPDIIAVRGAVCVGSDRHAAVDPERVAQLAQAAAEI